MGRAVADDRLITFDAESDLFRLYFPRKAPEVLDAVRALPRRTFVAAQGHQVAHWVASADLANAPALTHLASEHAFAVDEASAAKLREMVQAKLEVDARLAQVPQIIAQTVEGRILAFQIDFRGYKPELNAVVKRAGHAQFLSETKQWRLPFDDASIEIVRDLVEQHRLTIEHDLTARVQQQLSERRESVEKSRLADSDIHIPVPSGLQYLGYQKAGIAYGLEKGNVLIADEPGLGKTIQAIGLSNARRDVRKVLLVVPTNVKINWRREWKKWDTKGLSIGVVKGRKAEHWPQGRDVAIITYDLVPHHKALIEASGPWDYLVMDEAHNLRNIKAKRAMSILGLRERNGTYKERPIEARYITATTGTPIYNRPKEMWPLLNRMAPQHFDNFFQYGKRYCGAVNNGYGWSFEGSSNLHELQEKLRATIMVRRRKKDVLQELPPKTRQIITLEDESILSREHDRLRAIKEKAAELEARKVLAYLMGDQDEYKRTVAELKGFKKASFEEISKLRHATALAKVPAVIELVQEALENGKVILFAHHQDVINKYREAFGDACVVVNGNTSATKRDEAVQRFQTDPQCQVFIGGIRSAGEGSTLTASSHVIFAEIDWVAAKMTQAEDRAHRIGQDDNVLSWIVVVDGTIDAQMAEIIVQKQRISDEALDDDIEVRDDQADGIDAQIEEIEQAEADARAAFEEDMGALLDGFATITSAEVSQWMQEAAEQREQELAERTERQRLRAMGSLERAAERATHRAQARGYAQIAESMLPEEIASVHENLKRLSMVCDGALQDDGAGFNKPDTIVGKSLAVLPEISPLQAAYARDMLRKYVGQLGAENVQAMFVRAEDASDEAPSAAHEAQSADSVVQAG